MSNNEVIFVMVILAVIAAGMFITAAILSYKNNKLEEKITKLTENDKVRVAEKKYTRTNLERAIEEFWRRSRPSGKSIRPFISYTLTVNNSNNPVTIEFKTLYHKENDTDDSHGHYTRMFINDIYVLSYTFGYDSFNSSFKAISINKTYTVDSVLNMVCSLYDNFSSETQPVDINLLERLDSTNEK
jgi:hypothetical protein